MRVTPVEPSRSMREQRPRGLAEAVDAMDAVAEQLPFPDRAFDAAMTMFSVHQWSDPAAGLREMRRMTRGPVSVLTCDPGLVRDFWLYEYAPLVLDTEARRRPPVAGIADALGGTVTVTAVPIPSDCTDGFNEAYFGRPERFLDPGAVQARSAWSFAADETWAQYVGRIKTALKDGSWDARHGALCCGTQRPVKGPSSSSVRSAEGGSGHGCARPVRRRKSDSPPESPAPVAGPSCLARPAVGLVHVREGCRSVVERQRLVLPEVRGLEGVRRRRGRSRVCTAGRPFRGGEQRGQFDERSPVRYRPPGPGVP
ncbi:class I SAM-dependent methyltransferase [Streptomyces sp. NBC_01622]|uniref:class I SAM-dependent methyltransferase n=1 Tax=Streptomyces sp. NBC_01622 TaxID=2975903 RepID=UPI0038679FB0|nr:class I SAM-dependent methyltransferase [Streptomyces sp. NBC_01622]